ncbi:MAG: hypothetical protein JSW64_05225 [Candidatus Zixiibacteriota bacterium]|nr:MAG: hypothetical protein JSW64_05225 [candidate division Zixibacteria bacterium]
MISDERREKIRLDLEKFMGVRIAKKRIKSIEVNPRQRSVPRMFVRVGEKYGGLEPGAPEEEVLAIFESTLFCVCTPTRGVDGTPPYYFLREDIVSVEEKK